ncbi:hypothetical protein KI387_037362, partial [Taxus chinensis]
GKTEGKRQVQATYNDRASVCLSCHLRLSLAPSTVVRLFWGAHGDGSLSL